VKRTANGTVVGMSKSVCVAFLVLSRTLQPSGYERRNCTEKFSNYWHFCARSPTFVLVWLRGFMVIRWLSTVKASAICMIMHLPRWRHVLTARSTVSGLRRRSLHRGEVVGSIPTAPTMLKSNTEGLSTFPQRTLLVAGGRTPPEHGASRRAKYVQDVR